MRNLKLPFFSHVKFEIESQIALQVVQSCSQDVPSALHQSFSFSDCFKGLQLLGGSLLSGGDSTFGILWYLPNAEH